VFTRGLVYLGLVAAAAGALAALVVSAHFLIRLGRLRAEFVHKLAQVEADPFNDMLRTGFLWRYGAARWRKYLPFARAYRKALRLLAAYPYSTDLQEFALAVGQVHRGRFRPSGQPTTEDEASIRKDIRALAPPEPDGNPSDPPSGQTLPYRSAGGAPDTAPPRRPVSRGRRSPGDPTPANPSVAARCP
jgi:hypothetical protein